MTHAASSPPPLPAATKPARPAPGAGDQADTQPDNPGFEADFLRQVAGRQSIFAWYNVASLEFLYITRMPAAQAARIPLLRRHPGFVPRQSGAATFFVRKTTGPGAARTVAFAQIPGPAGDILLLLATREDLIANALALIRTPSDSVANRTLVPSTPPPRFPPKPGRPLCTWSSTSTGSFRCRPSASYWVQRNVTQMKQYPRRRLRPLPSKAPCSVKNAPSCSNPRSPNPATRSSPLSPRSSRRLPASTAPPPRTTPPPAPPPRSKKRLLGRVTSRQTSRHRRSRPRFNFVILRFRRRTCFFSRRSRNPHRHALHPSPASFSNQAVADALKSAGFDALLTWSSAVQPTATPAALWIPIHSAVILHATGSWNPAILQTALQQSLRGALTTGTLGIDFQPA